METKHDIDLEVLLAIARSKKARITRSRLEDYAETIAELRQKGQSYGEIASFLREHADIGFSRQMIHKFVAKMAAKANQIYDRNPPERSPRTQAQPVSREHLDSVTPAPLMMPSHITPETNEKAGKGLETPEKLEPLEIMTKEEALRYRQERLGSG